MSVNLKSFTNHLHALNETKTFQRVFIAVFIGYYLYRLEPYTWHYSEKLLVWPRSLFSVDPVLLNSYFPFLFAAWLGVGVWFLIRPQAWVGALFFVLSYLYVGRINSYIFILRYDFNPMAFLLLTLLLPYEKTVEALKLKKWIIRAGHFVWVSCFVTGAVAKFQAIGWDWSHVHVLRDFIFFENINQGSQICESPIRIQLLNFFMQSEVLVSMTAMFILAFESLYITTLFSRRIAIAFLAMTLVFQVVIEYMMNIQFYNYWVGIFFWLVYLAGSDSPEAKLLKAPL